MVLTGIGVIALTLSFLGPMLDGGREQDRLRHDGPSHPFRALATGQAVSLGAGAALLLSAFFVTRATIRGLGLLTVLNALLLVLLWPRAAGKDIVLLPPLGWSLAGLLFEDMRILVVSKRRIA